MIAEELSEFVSTTDYDALPEVVRERAKYLMLDAIGIAFASSTYRFAKTTFQALAPFGKGDSTVIGFAQKLTIRDAALMNGVLIHGLDFDDTYLPGLLHATSGCFPSALATAAELEKDGRDLLTPTSSE